MMKKYEEPKLDVIRFEMAEALTAGVTTSVVYDFGEDVQDW